MSQKWDLPDFLAVQKLHSKVCPTSGLVCAKISVVGGLPSCPSHHQFGWPKCTGAEVTLTSYPISRPGFEAWQRLSNTGPVTSLTELESQQSVHYPWSCVSLGLKLLVSQNTIKKLKLL